MLRRVKIKSIPQARTGYQVKGALANDVPAFGGADYNAYIGQPNQQVSKTLTAVPREEANLEAEGGETVIGNLDGSMMPSFKTIKGPRHSSGGVPLKLPEDSFIFSDTKEMKINDPVILKMFNKPVKKGGYTPAELSKKFDIQKYRKILQDPDTDKIDRKTAELMIKNAVLKLGALALAQESKKAFPQGIPEIAKPYMEANGIKEEDLIPQEPQPQAQSMPQEEGMNPMMQQMEGMNEAPMQMPNGQPVAMPEEMEQMSPEMMQEAPMAMYGMEMGGFYPEYAFGGLYKAQDGVSTKSKSKDQLEKELREGKAKVTKTKKLPDGTIEVTRADGTKVYAKGTAGESVNVADPKRQTVTKQTTNPEQYKKGICARMQKEGYTAEQAAGAGWIDASQIQNFKSCENLKKSAEETSEFYELDEPPVEEDQYKCECKDSKGMVYDPGKNEDGSCKDCEETIPGQAPAAGIQAPQRKPAKWWLQDTINTMGAFGDLARIQKQMPWEGRVDLEEPRPTFLDPTRELAAQSEQANIASQAAAQFAGPQALNARLSQIQGQGAKAAADTLSNINNQNVNIANQFEGQQVGVRNQENMLNQQMANRVFDKNVIANQQFQNAKTAGRANLRQGYSAALTNKAKTDALNQMYPNYQVDPSTGGMVNYTPTDKKLTPGEKEQDMLSFANEIKQLSPKLQEIAFKSRFGKLGGEMYKLGGQMFEKGGYVYTVFPSINL